MMKPGRMRELICLQLQQYHSTKRMLEEIESIGLHARPPEVLHGRGGHGDPTASDAVRAAEPEDNIRRMQGWVWAIEQAWDMLKRDAPHKARLMELLFGLDGELAAESGGSRREELLDELHISEPTLYRWRDDILHAVMAGAIEAGVLSPYGRTRAQRTGK